MATKIVGFDYAIAETANNLKADEKKARQRKASARKDSLHIRFDKGAKLSNNPFAILKEGK